MRATAFLLSVVLAGCGGVPDSGPSSSSTGLQSPEEILTFVHVTFDEAGLPKFRVATMTRGERQVQLASAPAVVDNSNNSVGRLEQAVTSQDTACAPGDTLVNDATNGMGSYTICFTYSGMGSGGLPMCGINYSTMTDYWCDGSTYSHVLYVDAGSHDGTISYGGGNCGLPFAKPGGTVSQNAPGCYWDVIALSN